MPLALDIHPSSDVLDIYGDADSSSTFSLSGHVSLSFTPSSSLFVRRRATTHVLLQSLTVTFEGQSEVISPSIGYAATRLCSITRELLPGGPLELSNEGHEESETPCLWNIIFDIPVPGSLPTTSLYGDARSLPAAGTSYALYATATFVYINHHPSPFSIANLCAPIRSRARTVDARGYPIILRRFVEPQLGSSSTFPMAVYVVDASRAPDSESSSSEPIPDDLLQQIQVVASIPSAMVMDDDSLPFILRLRGNLDDSEGRQLRITEFSVNVEQVEVYRNSPSPENGSRYPIPSERHQPPRLPLRNPHPIHTLYNSGFLGTVESNLKRTFSILAPNESGRYIISGDGHIFTSGQDPFPGDNWYIMEAKIPLITKPYSRDWAGDRMRRITEHSPLFSVEHYVHVVIHCEYGRAGSSERVLERLNFSLPMRHVNVPEAPIPSIVDVENQREDMQKTIPRKQSLPAYSQLFHSNGERKFDHSIPLPPYEPPMSSSGMASDLS